VALLQKGKPQMRIPPAFLILAFISPLVMSMRDEKQMKVGYVRVSTLEQNPDTWLCFCRVEIPFVGIRPIL
jgi:hypothetical protein